MKYIYIFIFNNYPISILQYVEVILLPNLTEYNIPVGDMIQDNSLPLYQIVMSLLAKQTETLLQVYCPFPYIYIYYHLPSSLTKQLE